MAPVYNKSYDQKFSPAETFHYLLGDIKCHYGEFKVEFRSYRDEECLLVIDVVNASEFFTYNIKVPVEITLVHKANGKTKDVRLEFDLIITPQMKNTSKLVASPVRFAYGSEVSFKSIKVWMNRVRPGIKHEPLIQQRTHIETLTMLNNPNFSDVTLLPEGSNISIKASKFFLAHASRFFHTMFQGNWLESSQGKEPIKLSFSTHAVFLALLHIYDAWIPGNDLSDHETENVTNLMKEISITEEDIQFNLMCELANLAQMYELKTLAIAAKHQMIELIQDELAMMQ